MTLLNYSISLYGTFLWRKYGTMLRNCSKKYYISKNIFILLPSTQVNNTRHASRKISAPGRVFVLYPADDTLALQIGCDIPGRVHQVIVDVLRLFERYAVAVNLAAVVFLFVFQVDG